MPFIGNKPSAVPLTSADITDNVITSAKIVDGTITNTDVASSIITGQTAETSIDGADSVLIYDDSATALRKMTRTNFVSGLGGLTNAQMFKINDTTISGGAQTLLTNIDDYSAQTGYGALGSLLVTESSGIFSFSQTGYYLISSNICFYATSTTSSRYIESYLYVSTNGGTSYSVANSGITSLANVTGNNDFANINMQHILDVTNASNFKFKIEINSENTVNNEASNNHSNITVIKLAET